MRAGFNKGEGVRDSSDIDDGTVDTKEGARGNAENRFRFVRALNGFPLLDDLLSSKVFPVFVGGYGVGTTEDERDIILPCPEFDPEPFCK